MQRNACSAIVKVDMLPFRCLLPLALVFSPVAAQQPANQTPAPPPPPAVSTMVKPAVSPDLVEPVSELRPQQIEAMQKKLADWPQLDRYRADDAKLGEPAASEQRVVFYGDSLTDNWGRKYGKFFPGRPYVNRGISGQTTPQMVVRFRQDVLNLRPAAVVILAGTNDIAGNTGPETLDEIEDNFRSMVALAKAAHIRVVLCSVLPASRFPWHPGVDPRDEIVALNTWLQGFAARQELVYLDYYPALVNSSGGMRENLAVDKAVHPNDAGYAVMEPLAEAAVRKTLTSPAP